MEQIQWFFSHRRKYWHLLNKTYNMQTYLPSSQVRPLNPAEHKHFSLLSLKPLRQVELFLQGFFAQALWCKNKKNSVNVLVKPIPLSYKSRSFWRCNIVIRLVKSLSFQIHRLLIKIKTKGETRIILLWYATSILLFCILQVGLVPFSDNAPKIFKFESLDIYS